MLVVVLARCLSGFVESGLEMLWEVAFENGA